MLLYLIETVCCRLIMHDVDGYDGGRRRKVHGAFVVFNVDVFDGRGFAREMRWCFG